MNLAIYTPPTPLPPFGKLPPQLLQSMICHECSGTGEIIVNSTYSLDPQEACSIPCECCNGEGEVEVCPTCQLEDCVCEEWLGVAA